MTDQFFTPENIVSGIASGTPVYWAMAAAPHYRARRYRYLLAYFMALVFSVIWSQLLKSWYLSHQISITSTVCLMFAPIAIGMVIRACILPRDA
jgi:hypothetical protein